MNCAARCRRYLQALAEQAQQKGNLRRAEEPGRRSAGVQQDLDKMLDNIEKLAKSGSKDMAEQMLSELKDILERLQTGNFSDNAKQQRAEQDDEGPERPRLQAAEAARRDVQGEARAKAAPSRATPSM